MHRLLPVTCFLSSVLLAQGPTGIAELTDIRRVLESLTLDQKKIERDLATVIDILSGRQPPLNDVSVETIGSPSLGHIDAKVTIVEFSDFQCPYCGLYARETFQRLVKEYVNAGKVRYVMRNFPVEQPHPLARKAAEASLCAADQGKYWELHDRYFANQEKLTIGYLPEHAAAISIDATKLRQCVEDGKYAAKVASDLMEGQDLGVRGTPTFFIGYTDPADASRIRAVRSITGNAPYREFQTAIREVTEASEMGARK